MLFQSVGVVCQNREEVGTLLYTPYTVYDYWGVRSSNISDLFDG
jgi:hypothetical protein